MNPYIITFNKINLTHLHEMGGKNASLEEMFNKLQPMGIKVPVDFAVTVERCRHFLSHYKLHEKLKQLWNTIDSKFLANLPEIGAQCRTLVSGAALPD